MEQIIKIKEYHYDSIFNLLSNLTECPYIDKNSFLTIINNLNDKHMIFIYEIDNNAIGTITLLIEQKLIHGGKCVGHIEDLVVNSTYKGRNIGKNLIEHCINIAQNNDCYKIILDCKEDLIPFYNKNNFKQQGVCMRSDII